MPVKKLAGGLFLVCFIALAALSGYEAYLVWRAEMRSDAILAAALSRPQPIALADVSEERKHILLKVEDPGFYDHLGVDFSSPGQGLTTITQALVKFLYFESFQPGFAKLEQSLIARFVLDRRLSKDQQLVIFINQAYFGHKDGTAIRGFAAASLAYFGKPFEALDRDDYIGLVGMLVGPHRLHPVHGAEAHRQRIFRIKRLLADECQPNVLDAWLEACAAQERQG